MTTTPEKDNIYIDVDDEITAIIDKMQGSQSKIVALVLPKRAVVLQSIVNMKLLKRAADSAKKNLVLITSDPNLLPLAGAANVYVAKNLQSKPEIPAPPSLPSEDDELAADVPEEKDADLDTSKPVGELATKNSIAPPPEETIEVDNSTPAAVSGSKASKAAKKKAKDKKNKIPNFEQFRKRLFLIGGAVVLLLIFWFMAVFTLPKAKIVIKTDTTNQNAEVNLIASPSATAVDENTDTLPAKAAEQPKSDAQKAPATGQKDVGTKATGTMTINNCAESDDFTVPGGSAFQANGKTFYSNATVTVPKAKFSSGSCTKAGVATVGVTAAENGDSYNVAATTYSSGALPGGVTAQGSAMGGGTSRIAKVVAQSDVDAAKAKFTNTDDAAKEALKKSLEEQGFFAIADTFTVKDPQITTSPNVGEEGTEVTVTSKGTYSMLGVKEDDLKALITASVEPDIDTDKQQVQDFGLANASFKVTKTEGNGNVFLSLDTQVAIGPKLDQDQIKQQIAGKKRGDTESIIKETPGVKEVKVSYSPFWVTKTPKKAAKINISVEKVN